MQKVPSNSDNRWFLNFKESTVLHTWDQWWTMKTNCGHSLQNYDSKIAHTYHTVKFSGPNSCPEIKLKLGKMYCDLYWRVGHKIGHIERMQSQRMPKEIATTTMEGTRKRWISRKMWTDEVQEGLNILGINNKQTMALDYQEWRRLYWKPRPTVVCSTRGGGGGGWWW